MSDLCREEGWGGLDLQWEQRKAAPPVKETTGEIAPTAQLRELQLQDRSTNIGLIPSLIMKDIRASGAGGFSSPAQ